MRARSSSPSSPSVIPFRRTEPELGRSRPAHSPSRVVFPLPDGPRIEQVLPAGNANEISFSTVNLPAPVSYVFVRCCTSRIERALMDLICIYRKWRSRKTMPAIFAIALGLSVFLPVLRAETPSTAGKKSLVFLGDSLTAGLGVQSSEAFPALIAQKISAAGLPFAVENAGLSGDTTAGGLRRIDWLLQRPIDIRVIELGANDGLRGLDLKSMKANLQTIIDKTKAKNPQVKIVLAGMQVPPNMGADYAAGFPRVFSELAQENKAALIPFLLEGVGGHRELNQADLIHPTPAGHRIIAELVWRTLEPMLRQS